MKNDVCGFFLLIGCCAIYLIINVCECVLMTGSCATNVIIIVCECVLMIGLCKYSDRLCVCVCFDSWIKVFQTAVQEMMRHQRVE